MATKILVIDDEKEMVETIKAALIPWGYEVISAFDGKEGLDKVKKQKPDLVICDIKMPKMNGWGVLKRMREDHARWVPVIMLTVLKEISYVKKGYECDADYYVTKPFKIEELLKGIRIILSLRPPADQQADQQQEE